MHPPCVAYSVFHLILSLINSSLLCSPYLISSLMPNQSFNWNVYHPQVLQSYKERHPDLSEAEFAGWRAQKRHNIYTEVSELTRNPYQSFHPIWHELWKPKKGMGVKNPGRSFIEELLLRDIFDAVCE